MSPRILLSRPVRLVCALLAAVALLAGCAEDTPSLDLREAGGGGDAAELPEGVAATVDGQQVPADEVEARFDAVAQVPEVAERLEGAEGEVIAETYRAQIVQNLITQALVAQSAEEMGLEPSEDDLTATEQQAIDEFGGDREEFREALRADGVTAEQLNDEIVFAARVDAIRESVADDFDTSEFDSEEVDINPADLALHEWFGQRLASADVVIDREYGAWRAETGEVVPPSELGNASE